MKPVQQKICYFLLTMDCERVQNKDFYPTGPLSWEESERNIIAFGDTVQHYGFKATFFAVPEAVEQHANIFKQLIKSGHEVGLHLHPNTFRFGINEYLGNLPRDIQYTVLKEARDAFEGAMGYQPSSFRPGYFSANQDTFQVLEELNFKRGSSIFPGRHLLGSGGNWIGWLRHCQYINSYFDAPITVSYFHKILFGFYYVQNVIQLMARGFFFAAIRKAAILKTVISKFKVKKRQLLIDLRIENGEYLMFRRIIDAELNRMMQEGTFPVLTSLTHSYINYTDCSYGNHEQGRSRKKCLERILGYLNKHKDITIGSKTLSELQIEYDQSL